MSKYSEAIDALKEDLGTVNKRKMKSGMVLRYKSGQFTYAAVYVSGKFFITGTGGWYGRNVFDYDEFVTDVLGAADKVQIAIEFEDL